jgi:hypothetical protein
MFPNDGSGGNSVPVPAPDEEEKEPDDEVFVPVRDADETARPRARLETPPSLAGSSLSSRGSRYSTYSTKLVAGIHTAESFSNISRHSPHL